MPANLWTVGDWFKHLWPLLLRQHTTGGWGQTLPYAGSMGGNPPGRLDAVIYFAASLYEQGLSSATISNKLAALSSGSKVAGFLESFLLRFQNQEDFAGLGKGPAQVW